MRSIVVLTVGFAIAAMLVVRSLPEGDAHADVLVVKTQEVQSISIDGGRGFPLSQIRDALQTKIGSIVDPAKLEQDRVAVLRELTMRGYLSATVSAPVVTYGPEGGVYIVFDVERGPLFHIRNVTFAGDHWSEAGVVPLASGDEARGDRLARVRKAAEETLARHGKHLQVHVEITTDAADAMIDVRLTTR
ncbi:MAG: hypothetical protein H0V17_08750 [Deltaproteobacteria bacterium]|nr:hypothetical protein [Deltaproteobacteria bacterium]